MKKLRFGHWKKFYQDHQKQVQVSLVVIGFVVIGGAIVATRAAGGSVVVEIENAQTSGNAFVGHDEHATASPAGDGHYIIFGAAPPVVVDNTLQNFASGLSSPVDITNSGAAGDTRLFVAQKGGKIRIVQANGSVDTTSFLDISGRLITDGERGLLGLAFHPNYISNGQFYVFYTDTSGNLTVSRFLRNASNPNVADPNSEKKLLSMPHPRNNHNGGALKFGPKDGYLYISTGDGGSGGDPDENGQDTNELLGKILRIDVDSGDPYAIPATNPFATSGGKKEVWLYGMRNPWRFSFDKSTGDAYIADVGQNVWEEVNFRAHGSTVNRNYGWDCFEGNHSYESTGCGAASQYAAPVHEYDHSSGRCSITGGGVYRGKKYPELLGQYLFADYCSGHLYKLARDLNGTWKIISTDQFSGLNITGFGEDINGEMYAASISNGIIYKVIASH